MRKKWSKATIRVNSILSGIKKETSILPSIYKKAQESVYALECANFNLFKYQYFFDEISEALLSSTTDPQSEIILQALEEAIESRRKYEIMKYQSRQKWSIIKQNINKIAKRLIFNNEMNSLSLQR